MQPMLKFVAKFAVVGAAIPVAFSFLSLAVPLFPTWLLLIVMVLCPPYLFFLATAACEPFDACSLNMLAFVVFSNATFYSLLGCAAYMALSYLKRRKDLHRDAA